MNPQQPFKWRYFQQRQFDELCLELNTIGERLRVKEEKELVVFGQGSR